MYASIRKYQVDEDQIPEVIGRVDEIFASRLEGSPGFAGYYAVDCGNRILITVTLETIATQWTVRRRWRRSSFATSCRESTSSAWRRPPARSRSAARLRPDARVGRARRGPRS